MADNGTAELSEKLILARIDELLNKRSILSVNMAPDDVSDYKWVKESMRSDNVTYDKLDDNFRFWGSADRKFSDTSLGGNYAINPRPQFTRYADPRSPGILGGRASHTEITSFNGNLGMGSYYSEAIDDTQQVIHVSCGVPEFNSLLGYFLNYYNHDAATMARSGRWAEAIGNAIGAGIALIVKVVFWKITLTMYAIGTASQALSFFMRKPASKFCYFKPTMVNYWSAVTAAVNQIATYKGMFLFGDDKVNPDNPNSTAEKVDIDETRKDQFRKMSMLMPDIYKEGFIDGFIDVYAIANRTQRIKNYLDDNINNILKNKDYDEVMKYTRSLYALESTQKLVLSSSWKGYGNIKNAVEAWSRTSIGKASPANTDQDKQSSSSMEKHIRTSDDPKKENTKQADNGMLNHLKAEFTDGSRFATFRVDHSGSVDESWSNATRESDIQSTFNQLSAQGRAASFSFAGGNIDGGVLSAVQGAVYGVAAGALNGVGLGGLLGLAGGGYADIPKHWDNSSANMPRMSYTMKLISPYGNPMSQMINIYIPMCMLLAMACPLSTGKQSYTSPFVLEVYDQGRAQTRYGMVDSLTFVRGTSNLGFNKDRNFMAVDVSISIADLSSVMHMPINNGFSLDPLKGLFDDDTVYSDYLNVLAAATLGQNVYPYTKFKLNLVNKFRSWQSMTSKARIAAMVHEKTPIGLFDVIYKDTERQ